MKALRPTGRNSRRRPSAPARPRFERLERRRLLAGLAAGPTPPSELPQYESVYFSTTKPGIVESSDGSLLEFDDADILGLNIARSDTGETLSYRYFLFFDGSDVGLEASGENIDALSILDDGGIVISTTGAAAVPGLSAADEDLLLFTPDDQTPGLETSGTWSLFLDASDVDLSKKSEDIDAVSVLTDGRIAVSTKGSFQVDGDVGGGEDVLLFTPASLGDNTAGSWELLFDGDAAGLESKAERVDAVFLQDDELMYISTRGSFDVPQLSGKDEDIFSYDFTAAAFADYRHVDGSQLGLKGFDIDALHIHVPPEYVVDRLNGGQPIVTQSMFAALGEEDEGANISSPAVIRVPDWIPAADRVDPSANYYLYFSHHKGDYIRMAWAAALDGPWHLFNVGDSNASPGRGVLDLDAGPRTNKIDIGNDIRIQGHIASPDVFVDDANQQIVMYFHGPTRVNGVNVGQKTFVATSANGLNFNQPGEGGQTGHGVRSIVLGESYFRVFEHDGEIFAIAKNGDVYRAPSASDPWTAPPGFNFADELWEKQGNPFRRDLDAVGLAGIELRHVAVRVVSDLLEVYYTRIGDAPERILLSRIDLTDDVMNWDASYPPEEILRPALPWEGANDPIAPSTSGEAPEGVQQLRDPYLFVAADGRTYLFYAGRGEDAIGVAEICETTGP